MIIDPLTNTYDTSTISGLPNGGFKWSNGILAPDGKIYSPPYNEATSFLIIDPNTNTIDTNTIIGFPNLGQKYQSICLSTNGKLYVPPFDLNNSVIIDIDSPISSISFISAFYNDSTRKLSCVGTTFLTTILVGDNILITLQNGQKFTGYVETVNNDLELTFIFNLGNLFTPIISLQKTRLADLTSIPQITSLGKYNSSCLAPNGKIYCSPFTANNVLIINPSNNSIDTSTISGFPAMTRKYSGAVLSMDGNIYMMPRDRTDVLIINPSNDSYDTTTITVSSDIQKYQGGILAPNNNIYAIPRNATNIGIIKTGLPVIPNWPLQSHFNNS